MSMSDSESQTNGLKKTQVPSLGVLILTCFVVFLSDQRVKPDDEAGPYFEDTSY